MIAYMLLNTVELRFLSSTKPTPRHPSPAQYVQVRQRGETGLVSWRCQVVVPAACLHIWKDRCFDMKLTAS